MDHTTNPAPPSGTGGTNGRKRLAPWRTIRQLSRRQWLYLPRLFAKEERIRIVAFASVALIVLVILTARLVVRFTVERPAVGGVLREGTIGEPRFVNPLYASSGTDRDIAALVFAKLIRYDRAGAITMDLAQGVEVSPDGKTYTATLRENAEWHDGEPVTASDVLFTIKAIQDPDYQSPLRQNWQGVTVEKVNERIVRFTLRQPYAPFMENLATGILPEHLWRRIPRESATLSDLNVKPVGSGPYRFEKLARHEDGTITAVTLKRSKRYHLDGPYLKEIRFSFYPDEAGLVAAYRRNEIDSFLLFSQDHRGELVELDLNLHSLRLPKVFAVFLNPTAQPALGRPAVRKALALAIDRKAIIENTAAGEGVEVNSAIPPGTFGFNGDIAPIAHDPEAAKQVLARDGWADSNGDGILERSEGSGRNRKTQTLTARIATSDAPELAHAADLIQEMWRAIGVETEVQTSPIGDLETLAIRPRAYEALVFGEVFGHDPDPFAFWHTSQLKDPGLNVALYSNQAVDRLLEEARRTADPAAREQKYREFQKIVADEVGAIFLYSPTHTYAIRKSIHGVSLGTVTLPEERFNEVHAWYADTRRTIK
ncbi:MAG: ABC transporter substrate-binding protein [Patescibacteria group bacterium]